MQATCTVVHGSRPIETEGSFRWWPVGPVSISHNGSMSKSASRWGIRRLLSRAEPDDRGLWHIVVAGGTCAEWASFSDEDWAERLGTLADVGRRAGARYVTVHPFEFDPAGHDPSSRAGSSAVASAPLRRREFVVEADQSRSAGSGPGSTGSITVVADPAVDGRQRICDELARWPSDRVITEETLGRALFGPAGEPDLVVILGSANRLPVSLVWELAYSELVFIPATWNELSSSDVIDAVQEFSQRSRRFGGVEE